MARDHSGQSSQRDAEEHEVFDLATETVCDLLASAEEAALRGQRGYADYLLYRAERMALRAGLYSLIGLVWRHAPLGRAAPS